MRTLQVKLEDDVYWYVFGWAAREQKKAHELGSELIAAAVKVDQERQPEQAESVA